MINRVALAEVRNQKFGIEKTAKTQKETRVSQNQFNNFSIAASNSLKANSINMARTIRFTGALEGAFKDLNQSVQTCKTKDDKGEAVGSRINANRKNKGNMD